MLIHSTDVTFEGGHGGPGKVSFFKKERGPDGGDGGHGGNLYVYVTTDLSALNQFSHKHHLKAPDGAQGTNNRKAGLKGEDLEILLPIGSELTDVSTGEKRELLVADERILIAKGGQGGMGNAALRSARDTTPQHAQRGLPGEVHEFHIELRFLADIGLIGLPNAGKSSLLNSLTNADAKIGNYPFTTLEANLGVMGRGNEGKVLADIPGLIEGASEGKGLGIKFLKQIEKVKIILHCLSVESDDLVKDYKIVRTELEKFNPEFLTKKEIILVTKSDLYTQEEVKKKSKSLNKLGKEVLIVSVNHQEEIAELKKEILKALG